MTGVIKDIHFVNSVIGDIWMQICSIGEFISIQSVLILSSKWNVALGIYEQTITSATFAMQMDITNFMSKFMFNVRFHEWS